MFKVFHKDHDGCGHHHEDQVQPSKEEKLQPIIPPKSELFFKDFVQLFPAIQLPLSISSEMQRLLAEQQEPLNAKWMEHFILNKDEEVDEFTEYMACFSLPNTEKFIGLVYWQASLEGNAFFLVTFTKGGTIIDHRLLAGTLYLEDELLQIVCSIATDWSVTKVEAKIDAVTGLIIKTEKPKQVFMQITLDGEILEE